MEASIQKRSELRVISARHVGPYQSVGPTWQKLCAWAGPRGVFGPQTLMLGLCHDDPQTTPPEQIRYDACLTVGPDVKGEGEFTIQTIAGGDYAVAIHRGPYEKLGETYTELHAKWIPAQGRRERPAPPYEIYRNNPSDTPPENLVTEICVPLA